MSLTQFAMVEELAFLVKDNLPSKHLVLSMEEALVNFLEDDNGAEGVLELEPMNPYNRLLLHRLADIFGFAHESLGEGDDRHLVLERGPETSICCWSKTSLNSRITRIFRGELRPSILVSDILWQYGKPETLTTSHLLLRRKEAPRVEVKNESPSIEQSFEEREAAYLAARERIFSTEVSTVAEPVRQKPRNVPLVARRMIAHALGQKIKTQNQDDIVKDNKECEQSTSEVNVQDNDRAGDSTSLEACQDITFQRDQTGNSVSRAKTDNPKYNASSQSKRTVSGDSAERSSTDVSTSRNGRSKSSVNKEYSKEQHVGAAKRMFAHALGLHSTKDNSHLK